MTELTWIEEQKKNRLFRGPGAGGGDAIKMLEKSETNRYLSAIQVKIVITCRYIAKYYALPNLFHLCDMLESGQLVVDGHSRSDFMKVAIEQWQGKLANLKSKINLESLV